MSAMFRFVLNLLLLCLLTNGQGLSPDHQSALSRRGKDSMQSRAADKRVRFSVSEGKAAGTFVGIIPLKPGYKYRFNEAPKQFVLNDTTGVIITTAVLDREALVSDRFDLVVLSSQPTYPIEVRIDISDVNDNAPTFPESSIHVSFSENANAGTRVILDTATDGDSGRNDITTNYKIVTGNDDDKFRLVVTTNPSGETPYLHLETTEKLDRESIESYQLNISAEDGGVRPHFGFLLVNVSVLDVNDNSPTFDHSDYIVSLSESVPLGTSVLHVKATDIDLGENSRLSYYLSATERQFSVDSETGFISTLEPLRCHRSCAQKVQCEKSCVFTVFARDHGSPRQDGRTYVTVNLQDANDHDPILSFSYYSQTAEFATVDENAQFNSNVAVVSVLDADEGLNGETTTEIRGGNELKHFRLDSSDSFDIVRVNGVLDREKISKYNVTIVATDKGTPVRSSTSFLIIHVNDINDHEPVFEKSEYSAILSEFVPLGTFVAGITANDEDTGVNSNIYYDITSGNDNQWFAINRQSGLITTKAMLNREVKDSIDLNISARDGGPNPKRAYTTLKVTILDENDEHPTFIKDVINVTLSENAKIDTLVAIVSAVDHDRGTNGSVYYSFHDDVDYNYKGIFSLDSTNGRITTKRRLDREMIHFFTIKIVAKDQGVPPLSSTATVYLEIDDVNDNSPEFYPQQYLAVVPEDLPLSSTVVQVRAIDKDIGSNSVITYEINNSQENDNTFEIDPDTGTITLSGRLSRIRKSQYSVSVSARDKGNRKSIQDAVITIVIESNEIELLQFGKRHGYKFTILEDPGMKRSSSSREVGRISLDSTILHGKVNYAIVSGDVNKVFNIDKKSGIIRTVKRIDREQIADYFLEAVATTESSSYGRTWINITVDDVNDNSPDFSIHRASATVYENWPVGHQVFLARANDRDEGSNGEISYQLTKNPDNLFNISPKSGMIYLKKSIKYGSVNEYSLEVTATDSGSSSLSSTQIIIVTVKDVNDHTPIFEHESYETSLLESTPVNDRFFALAASDKDSDQNGFISYAITEGNDDRKFGIFPDGFLYVKSALDREEKDYFALIIIARDHGEPSRSSTVSVVIHVLDENDNSPKFSNTTFTFFLDENEPPDTYVGRLTASDLDRGRNAELTYAIAADQTNFVVDPKSGFLKSLHYFDREKLMELTRSNSITMEGIVLDNGVKRLKDKTKIVVYISDINDNAPRFRRKSYRSEISELAEVKSNIIRLYADDADEGDNGDIFYSILTGNQDNHFILDKKTGQLSLSKALDRETISVYYLEVAAMDNGSPKPLSATTTLTIDVLDENDNVPQFISKDLEISVSENTQVNTVLYHFQATDADLRMNKRIEYHIGGGNVQDTFHIDSKTGTLILDRPLDYEQKNVYQLNVTAQDSGTPKRISSMAFRVKVLDYNDNPPTFPNTAIVRQIKEGILPNTAIVTVTADDPDSGDNGKIKYTISHEDPPGNHFAINENSGVIKTLKDIDREFADTFRLTVSATDQTRKTAHRLTAQKLVTVIVEDVNDNAPHFTSMNAGILPTNALAGYEIMKIIAKDDDANSNGQVTYDLIDGAGNKFLLARNGSLKLRKKLSQPQLSYEVTVRASDEAVQEHIQLLDETISILVHDPSEEGPQFTQASYSGSVIEGTGIGTSVVVVSANLISDSGAKIAYYVVNITSEDGESVDRVFDIQHGNIVSTVTELDREDGPQKYILTIAAIVTDGTTPRLSTAEVRVTVLDKNDSPPFFGYDTLKFNVSEDLLTGRKIAIIQATDPDTIGTIRYSLVSGDDNKFSLDASSGYLSPKDTLDRETKSSYKLTVRADDGRQYTDATVYIEVTDTNDNAPMFTEPAYSFDITEDSERGSKVGTVTATDSDQGTNGHISYTVISEWGNDVFSLNPQTGEFTLTSRLDYEQVQHYIFVVQAQDTGRPALSSTVVVYFNVKDLNDNAPIFDPMSYSDEILENITVGSSVLTVSATDQDSGLNGKIAYSIMGGDDKHEFSIRENGTIVTEAVLDREEQSFYNLIVSASDLSKDTSLRLSSSVQVTIVLRDVNDMAPEFVTPNEKTVAENTPINTVIMVIKAVDKDEGRNSYIEYSLEPVPRNTFMLGPADGLLRITGPLDREERANYSLVVTATDRGSPPNARTLTINLKVSDENDNSPIFDPKQYSASVPENASIGASVLHVSATDEDVGFNGRVRYTIVAGDKNRDFTISEDTGVIRVAKNLNYERRNHYLLTVQAEDSGDDVRYDSATVTISIMDINDNAPVFLDSPYLIYVMENMKGLPTTIATVTAFDADNSPYNTVNYLVKDGDKNLFSINSTTGEISLLKAIDREHQDKLILTIIAMDTGTPRLTGTGTISVIVEDENDHAPTFPVPSYKVSVSEATTPDTPILTITAMDGDTEENAKIRYSLIGGATDMFSIDYDSGVIKTKDYLDREMNNEYFLDLEAKDSSLTEPRSATTKIEITITDENDNGPVFNREHYTVYVPTPTLTGDFIFGDAATDPDEGENGRIIYHLSGDDADKFDLDQWKGIIKASTELKGENTYNIIVGAQDFGSPPRSSSTTLRIYMKPSDQFPIFQPVEKTFSFSEHVRHEVVTTVTATSPKNNLTPYIRYRIAGGNIGQAFTINERTGEIKISEYGIDYESLKQYELYLSASDGDDPPLASTLYLAVNVSDYNDNPPVFSSSIYNASLMEDLYPPQLVTTVYAADKDSDDNAQVYYRLLNNGRISNIFSLDSDTGQIYTKVRLKREEVDRYELNIEAIDKGSPSKSGSTTVIVVVEDKNNNPPRFTRLFSVNVTENSPVGTFVIQVTSSDRDIGVNANVSYSFTENPYNKFRIDPISGNVTVASPIDRERRDEFALKVSASDGSWKAETPLTITVQDENDNPPLFESKFYEFNFPELQRSVVFVGQVRAFDKDKHGPNSAISFFLKFPSDFFSVDSVSGEILSKQALKYKHTLKGPSPENQYHLLVVATDNGKPPMSSETTILINVVDANNNQPSFEKKKYFSPVPENAEINQNIIQLKAIDKLDYGINAQILYKKNGGNGTDYFSLDTKTGWVKLSRKINGKIGTHFVLLVKAEDRGVPPLYDEVPITFVVTGENKYQPKFTASSYQLNIAENEKLGVAIGTVSAFDQDIGPNGVVQYSISSGNEADKFAIDEDTGEITILNHLDYDSVKEYRLNITGHDLAFEPSFATAVLTILLTDINDNPPKFDQPEYKAFIPENSRNGTIVYHLNATDIDSAQNAIINYNIIGGDGQSYFLIDTETGIITSRTIFDYEVKFSYSLTVMAANPESSQRSSVKIQIYVTGRNEYYPNFLQPIFQFTISESARIGTSVGTIQASDMDKGDDGIVYYLLVGASNDRGFHIELSTGIISVARNLDRESQNRVVLTVMAKNAGSILGNDTDEAQIIISIQDGNDPPIFEKPYYRTYLSEGALIGTEVTTVVAFDSDVRSQNNQFTYSIIGGNFGQVFKVDPQTGIIETTAQLDRETIQVYNLTVGAIDNGIPAQTGTTLVQVILEDINDNGPQFDSVNIIGYVAENEPAMTSVMTLSASDPDLPPNTNPFYYYIIGGEHKDFFSVEENTGTVKTTRTIDRETTSELNFRIEVHDGGKPKMKSEFPVKIIILDKNDSPSTPRTVTVRVLTFRGEFPGGKIADVHPNDADTSGQYSCKIISQDSSIFSIPNACNLHVIKGVHDHSFTLHISGSDGQFANVTSKVEVEFETFDNASLENSFVIRLLNVTSDKFLQFYYNSFLASLTRIFPTELIHIYSIYDVTSHTDLTIAAERLTSDDYLLPSNVVKKMRDQEKQIMTSLQGLKFIIDYDQCNSNPCENGGICSSSINAHEDTEITDSPTLVMTTSTVKKEFVCKCGHGFAGERCNLRQDPCSPNPCQFGGTCSKRGFHFTCTCPPSRQGSQCQEDKTNKCDNNPCRNGGSCQTTLEGDFFCLCRPGFRGNKCELESESCRPNPCQNGGSCISLRPGYRCSCAINFYGAHCEKSSFSFDELSFMTFPTLDLTTNDISIVFATNKPDALLVYNFGVQTGGRSDFIAIELSNGKPKFSYGGARTEITYVMVDKYIADGNWYKLTATRNGRAISLNVVLCPDSGEICDTCEPNDSSCSASDTGHTRSLNFNNEPMYLGGVMTVDPIQERPNQVYADDFIGCVQRVSISGRPLNLSGPIQKRGISDVCKRVSHVCDPNPCGKGGQCLDRWSTYMCLCSNGLLAPNCNTALKPMTFNGEAYLEFLITENHRRKQLLPSMYQKHSRWDRDFTSSRSRRQLASLPSKTLSFKFRTLEENGILFHAATNTDFTLVEILNGYLVYTSKLGANKPMNMTIKEQLVGDGSWHNFTLISEDQSLKIMLDGTIVGEELSMSSVHDFLDAYLTSLTLGHAPLFSGDGKHGQKGIFGCMAMLNVNGEIQPFNGTTGSSAVLKAVSHGALFIPDCATIIGAAAAANPLSIGIILVIVFFTILFIILLGSFIGYRFRNQSKKEKDGGHVYQNGSALLANTSSDSGRTPQDSGYVESAEMTDDVLRSHLSQEMAAKKYKDRDHDRPQRPDIIEREVINKSPGGMLKVDDNPHGDSMGGMGHMQDNDQPEHYDLENASSIAPSDIDIVCHYKGYRDGNIRKYKTNPHVPGYHKHNHRHSPHNFPNTPHRESPRNILRQSPNPVAPRDSPSVLKMQSTPLARLSPSSELSQQTPRILTLQDLSGKPLQTALLATSQGPGVKDVMSNSERSLNSPVSHLSQSSGSIHASSQSTKKKKHDNVGLGLTADEIDRLNSRPRNSSLLTTLDAVSSSSEDHTRKEKLAELLEANTELLEANDSSSDESGNDSFTCSEFEYDNNYEKVTRDFGPGTMIFSKLAEVDNENDHDNESAKNYDGFDSFRGSLSTLVASDDDLSNMSSYKPPNGSSFGWDNLLNWGPNYESLVGVFKDIAELPDNNVNGRISNRGTPKPSEEYV